MESNGGRFSERESLVAVTKNEAFRQAESLVAVTGVEPASSSVPIWGAT